MLRLLPALVLLAAAPLAAAQIYTWTDAGGTVHFSEAPPAAGQQYREIKTAGGTTTAARAPAKPAAREGGGDGDAAPPPPTANAQPMEDTPDNRKKLCATLTANITTLSQNPPAAENQGSAEADESARRQALVAQAQSQYQQYCQ